MKEPTIFRLCPRDKERLETLAKAGDQTIASLVALAVKEFLARGGRDDVLQSVVDHTFGARMRERADQVVAGLLAPHPDPIIDQYTIDSLLAQVKGKILRSADQGAYYCTFTLYGRFYGVDDKIEKGIFENKEEALAIGPLLAGRLEAEGIEAVVGLYIGRVSLELAWRPERSLRDGYET